MTNSRVRVIRAQAKRLGWTVTKIDDTLEIYGYDEVIPNVSGSIEFVGAWLAERAVHRPSGPAPVHPPETWRPWIDLFVSEQNAAHRSASTIKTRIGHLVTFAHAHPGVTPMTVARDQLLTWVGDRSRAPRTAHSIRSTMRVFFSLLYDLGHRRDNPARTLPSVSLPRSLPRPCPDHAVRHAYDTITDERLLLAVRITVETGMRRAEVARVHPGDVEGRAGDYRLHIVGKGSHERTVPLSDDLAERILEFDGYLFAGRDGEPITPRWLGTQISEALPGEWTTHTLRHRFATVAYQATSDLRAVQELLGHTSPVTTAIYTKVADNAMRTAATAAAL